MVISAGGNVDGGGTYSGGNDGAPSGRRPSNFTLIDSFSQT